MVYQAELDKMREALEAEKAAKRATAPAKRARRTSATTATAPSDVPAIESIEAPTMDAPTEIPSEAPATVSEVAPQRPGASLIGTVVTLRDALGCSVPEDLRGWAVTVTDGDPERNEIQFVVFGRKLCWYMDAVEPVRAMPLAIEPALQE